MPHASFSTATLQVRSDRDKDKFYTVTLLGGVSPVACTCPSYEHRDGPLGTLGGCKHMRALVGPKAVGTTKCQHCRAFLTPADFDYDAQMAAAQSLPDTSGSVTCMQCWE